MKGQLFESGWSDGANVGDEVLLWTNNVNIVNNNPQFVKGQVVGIKDTQYYVRIVESDKEVLVDKSDVFACFKSGTKSLTNRQIFQSIWGGYLFGRVSRIVKRANDLNIFLEVPHENEDGTISTNRAFLGDNINCVKSLSKDDFKKYVKLEYGFFYGFCGFLNRKQQRSHNVRTQKTSA